MVVVVIVMVIVTLWLIVEKMRRRSATTVFTLENSFNIQLKVSLPVDVVHHDACLQSNGMIDS